MTKQRRPGVREVPEQLMRAALLWLSRRRALGRLAIRVPLTAPMVRRFVAGETLAGALTTLRRLQRVGLRSTVDVLGEAVTDPDAARAATVRYLEALDALADAGLDRNVSLKLSQMGLRIDADLCRRNVADIVGRARELDAFVRFDMEDHTATDATLSLARAMRADGGEVGVVIQSALRRSADDVERLIRDGTRVRLCKGAYREPAGVAFPSKAEVDASFERLMGRLLRDGRYPALATHDERLVRRAIALCRREGIGPDRFEFQMLYGVRRDLQDELVRAGWTVRVYVPYGRDWYPYFMRRLAERPANVWFVLRSVLRERRLRD